ncbi:MAG: tyrosine-type recombinase/integrase [Caldisericum exile]|uniref:tyrosine-type recombinase/integrase n=1 Tax=Caldisericum exile TaxID=693075 RepID=UPI003C71D429
MDNNETSVCSTPIPSLVVEPTCRKELVEFGIWLMKNKGNRESTITKKLKMMKQLRGSVEDMFTQVLSKNWCDKSKDFMLRTIQQYAEFLGLKVSRPKFKVYDNREIYVPNPSMIKQLLYRISNVKLRAMCMIAIETGATESEVFNLKWNDVNLANKSVVITGVKGHRTFTYQISDELCTLLMQVPRMNDKVFTLKNARTINDWMKNYVKRLARETGNPDFRKIHFHTLRHFAISWYYFKTKDIVDTQRFARHCDIRNTLRYVHIIKSWIKSNEYDVVYTSDKIELSKYLSEGYELVAKTEWGYCLRKPKSLTE